jgi:F-type H+-transporting ATPase subunit epsilon
MSGHQPLMTMLYPGIILAIDAEGKARRAFIQGGFAEIANAIAFEEVTPKLIHQEILRLQMAHDATSDGMLRTHADAAVSCLEELTASGW